jgi:glutamate formiminotransferase/formiminotetrahydrofolate cyclodeaminase
LGSFFNCPENDRQTNSLFKSIIASLFYGNIKTCINIEVRNILFNPTLYGNTMQNSLIECVPNFSEARRPEVVEAIADAINTVGGVRILDRHSDLDHNRTVMTFVGSPDSVEEAAFRAISRAAELIDLEQHTGEHPRIGATDVVPFIPISGASMDDCVKMANRLGQRVGEELDIPVYLYEAAATRQERINLENIRRGQYERIKEEIKTNPDRKPDFGPAKVGPAGATIIGARPFLIAYNVYLTTDDKTIADNIARAVRHSSGGLRYVKALGMQVDGRAQVSMNLTNFRRTPMALVVEMIRREAARYGVAIHHSELVGLIPQDALINAAVWHLQLDQFESDQILENRLFSIIQESDAAEEKSISPKEIFPVDQGFLNALASKEPTPGGGGKKKYLEVEDQMREIADRSVILLDELNEAVSKDSAAFDAVMDAYRLPKDNEDEKIQRSDQIQAATLLAAQIPLQVAKDALELTELAQSAALLGNLNAISDAGSAAALAGAAISGAALNVRINAQELKDIKTARGLIDQINELERRAANLQNEIQSQIRERGNLS